MANRNTQGFGLIPAGTMGDHHLFKVKGNTKSMLATAQLYTMVNVLKSLVVM